MKILPPSQIKNLPIMEEVLEELRLNVIDHIQHIAEALDLYSLNTEDLKRKLNLLGLTNINIGKFISLDLNSDEFEYISPEFYKMYRKLNQHRGNKMSMDYIFHSAGMMNTLVHSNTTFYSQDDIFGDTPSFFEFNTYRDNDYSDLGIGDGYIIVPYSSNRSQTLKQYLAKNPIIFSFLPAGYTFIFLSEYRNGYDNGVLHYDNLLDYRDILDTYYYYIDPETGERELRSFIYTDPITHETTIVEQPYFKPLYWEPFDQYKVEEIILLDNDEEFPYIHTIYYYDPFIWRDKGYRTFFVEYPRFTNDSIYDIPLEALVEGHTHQFKNLQEFLDYYAVVLNDEVMEKVKEGYEADLNNTLFFKDIWLGDYLLSSLMGEIRIPEHYDHVMGMQSIQAPTYSYASLYSRGESLASQYMQREEKVVSTADSLIQEHKKEIISDRRETDLFKYHYSDEYSLWLVVSTNDSYTSSLLLSVIDGLDQFTADYISQHAPHVILDCIDYPQAEAYFYQLIQNLFTETIFEVMDGDGNVILTNANQHSMTMVSRSDNQVDGNSTSMQVVNTRASISTGTGTIYLGSTPIVTTYIDI